MKLAKAIIRGQEPLDSQLARRLLGTTLEGVCFIYIIFATLRCHYASVYLLPLHPRSQYLVSRSHIFNSSIAIYAEPIISCPVLRCSLNFKDCHFVFCLLVDMLNVIQIIFTQT